MIQITKGFPEDQRATVAALYWEAFGGKLGKVFGPDARALRYITQIMRPDHCCVAIDPSGRVLGVAGFKTPEGGFVNGTSAQMQAVYGWFGARWRGFALWLLAHEVDNENFLIDGIAVTRAARGQGIGTALLEALCQEGQARGYASIRLEVIDSNWRAKALYERQGFVVGRTDRLGLLGLVFGFKAATTMLRPL
ncbi:GNAT family N-acetyltransferase [Xinfangfangia sp. CPCC 101601]|uniref:GNAT family N-acetyltransferase n=1 Tax=Pseudogemmobacter lacusdianii TaxID=3069608 RepID=A0ABU0VX18_9RHOB|nr:GNAT family N-acetyltransferase [Xinfangfangia sp. CPCC 101601]MDQ2066307.1 GNAT family N-acetyltransferase [Xinfangfangia sp. CPCC 101601]